MSADGFQIRPFTHNDVEAVWTLMRALAVFEGYIDTFAVTPDDLRLHGLGAAPAFGVFVAAKGEALAGIAVHYRIPWTYDLKPVVVLKELFVAEEYRGQGAGQALFAHVRAHAAAIGASALRWTVLPDNVAAKRFYAGQGGACDADWEHWTLPLQARI
ncbi:GNAT family N-acetyltransferase [Shinella curvata]|uniref:GNAT family N-acetyltransferase n=1 Tax=Shinella curvata TaxID=1817964 RepID=A0ABT8XAP0_9HYPH|nr:GNAT family N-acetyltransferase [Shinella curvata]MCJ8051733.1 GNAT family N-acetyltransferase [Shinella curvata]MDO6120320.1 GNAT family N-acetyltransferase [Shinella curvata]